MGISSEQNGNRAPLLLIVTWILTAISTILAFCRFFTRLRIVKAAGKDDIALALSVVRPTTL